MKILSVTSEIYPLVKTGGLADVAGALPAALAPLGVEMRSLVPGYPAVLKSLKSPQVILAKDGWRVLLAKAVGMTLYVLDAPAFFDRKGGPYVDETGEDWPDNWQRFALLSQVASFIANGEADWQPDVVHCHDWQAGLVPAYINYSGINVPTVITVHNIAFQGQFGAHIFDDLGLPPEAFSVEGVEYYGDVSYLKAGLQLASAITTVSPSYAQEIKTPKFGMGLEGVIESRGADVHGIVNGIDTVVWNPEADPAVPQPYTSKTLKRRTASRDVLQDRFALVGDGPIFAVVSRLTWQKGLDLLVEAVDTIVEMGGQLAILGSGDPYFEDAFRAAADRHAGRVGTVIGYDENLSHLVQAGADAFLMPSRFEPCGLTQLYALRYGCVPIVSRTGGLADTIIDSNMAANLAGVATGYIHSPDNFNAFIATIQRAITDYKTPKTWSRLQRNGMKTDVSWTASATRYSNLYEALCE